MSETALSTRDQVFWVKQGQEEPADQKWTKYLGKNHGEVVAPGHSCQADSDPPEECSPAWALQDGSHVQRAC